MEDAPQAMDMDMDAMDGEMGDADAMDGEMDDMAGEGMDMDMEMEAPVEEDKSDNYANDPSK